MSRFILMIGPTLLILGILSIFILHDLLPLPGHVEHEAATTTLAKETGICGCGGGGGSSNPPSYVPPTVISQAAPSGILVAYNTPKKMDINTSDVISLKLGTFPAISLKDRTSAVIGTSISLESDLAEYCAKKFNSVSDANFCRFATKLSDIFGPNYQIFASAHLVANSLDVHLLGSEEQTLDQPLVEWNWNIAPKVSGIQTIDIDIEFEWKPISNVSKSTAIVRQVWNDDERIEVSQPWIELGQISLIPLIITALGGSFTLITSFYDIWEKRREKKKTENTKLLDGEVQETILKEYIDKISELLLHDNLRESAEDAEVRRITRASTLAALSRLGAERRRSILQFLYSSGLVEKVRPIIDLRGCDLSYANLSHACLQQINLKEVDLSQADLSYADLSEADLTGADLSQANLFRTNFSGANLSHVNMNRAYWRREKFKLIHVLMDYLSFNIRDAISSLMHKILLFLKNSGIKGMIKDVLQDALLQLEVQHQSNLREAYPTAINLSKPNLSGVDLSGADLSGTELTEVDLQDAIISNNDELDKRVRSLHNPTMQDKSAVKTQTILEPSVLKQEQLANLLKEPLAPVSARRKLAPIENFETQTTLPRSTSSTILSPKLQQALDAYRNGHTTSRSMAIALGCERTKAAELLQQLKARRLVDA